MEKPDFTLQFSREEMRRIGYAVIDSLVEYHDAKRDWPVSHVPDFESLAPQIEEEMPSEGRSFDLVLSHFTETIARNISHVDHPRFFAFVPGPGNFVAAMADTLASGFNIFAGTWLGAAAAAQTEKVVVDWLRDVCGLPRGAGGLFVSGGSMANLTALAVARFRMLENRSGNGVAYCSDQTHTAVDRALRVLGFPQEGLRRIASDGAFRLDMSALKETVARDRQDGLRPFCVIGNAGTTNTGAIDPLVEIAAFCLHEGLWNHIDGAYGAAAVVSSEGKRLLQGMDAADSIALDPHKWLFQPFETGCVLFRDAQTQRDAFRIMPEYMRDTERDSPRQSPRDSARYSAQNSEEINYCEYGIQLSRGFRALKLWMSLQVYGTDAFAAAVEYGLELARWTENRIRSMRDWTVMSPATLGIVTFHWTEHSTDRRLSLSILNTITQGASTALRESGLAMVSTTMIRGVAVLRMCTINPNTTHEDIETTLQALDRYAKELRRQYAD